MSFVCGRINSPNQGTAQQWPCPMCQPITSSASGTGNNPQIGWICPVCHKGNAPHADRCGHCADSVMAIGVPLPGSVYVTSRPGNDTG